MPISLHRPLLATLAGLALALALLAGLGSARAAARPRPLPTAPISLADFCALVDDSAAEIDRLQAGQGETPAGPLSGADRASLESLARRWQAVAAVQAAEGALLSVDGGYLAARLRADPPDLAHLAGLFAGLAAAGQDWPQGRFGPEDLRTLEDILRRPEFQWQTQQPSLLSQLIDRLWRWGWDLINRLLGARGATFVARWGLIILAVLTILLALVLVARALTRSLVAEAGAASAHPDEENLTTEAALQRAQDLSGAGDYRQAARYLYLSALLLLEERGLLRYDRTRTNREYLKSVAHLPHLAAQLRQVVEVFDRVWYGFEPLDQAEYDRYAQDVAALRQTR